MRNCTAFLLPSASVIQLLLKPVGGLPLSSPSWTGLIFKTILCAGINILSVLSSYTVNPASSFLEIVESSHRESSFSLIPVQAALQLAVRSSSTHRKNGIFTHGFKRFTSSFLEGEHLKWHHQGQARTRSC